MKIEKIAFALIVFIATITILYFGENLLIPIIFAIFLWFIISEISGVINRIAFFRHYVPSWIKNLFVSVLLLGLISGASSIITSNISSLSLSYDKYQLNIQRFISSINSTFKIDLESLANEQMGNFDFGSILTLLFNSLTGILGNAFIIIIYAVFIFLEEANFRTKLSLALGSQYDKTAFLLHQIERSVRNYIGLKTFLSFLTGIFSYFALLIIGVEAPAFWAFLIFLLNYIPTVGSLIATVFPAIFSIFQFGEILPAGLVLIIVGAIQVLVGNFLEPKMMGNSLNVSSLVAIISLSLWGALWGVTGMILSVPITVIIVIICSQFESTKAIAIMLSEKGKLND